MDYYCDDSSSFAIAECSAAAAAAFASASDWTVSMTTTHDDDDDDSEGRLFHSSLPHALPWHVVSCHLPNDYDAVVTMMSDDHPLQKNNGSAAVVSYPALATLEST